MAVASHFPALEGHFEPVKGGRIRFSSLKSVLAYDADAM